MSAADLAAFRVEDCDVWGVDHFIDGRNVDRELGIGFRLGAREAEPHLGVGLGTADQWRIGRLDVVSA